MIKKVSWCVTTLAVTAVVAAGSATADVADQVPLQRELDAVHEAGMPGVEVAARHGEGEWSGAAGVADVHSGRPMGSGFEHRVGSITKSFTAAAVLQQAGAGTVELDAPIGKYLPELVPGERGQKVTVRMLLNHTSGIGDFVAPAFPSFQQGSLASLEENRFRQISPAELIRLGLEAPPTGEPGQRWSYSNTNYIIAGELLGKVTGQNPQRYITEQVIAPLGLRHTYFPGGNPNIRGGHSQAYEALYNIPPQRGEYSVYNMDWAGTAGALVSTPEDLNEFYRALLSGEVVAPAQLDQMKTGVPVLDGTGKETARYGLGLMMLDGREAGWLYGHTGAVFGMETLSVHSVDGARQVSYGLNLTKYQNLDEHGAPKPHPIDDATVALAAHGLGTEHSAAMSPSTMPKMPVFDK